MQACAGASCYFLNIILIVFWRQPNSSREFNRSSVHMLELWNAIVVRATITEIWRYSFVSSRHLTFGDVYSWSRLTAAFDFTSNKLYLSRYCDHSLWKFATSSHCEIDGNRLHLISTIIWLRRVSYFDLGHCSEFVDFESIWVSLRSCNNLLVDAGVCGDRINVVIAYYYTMECLRCTCTISCLFRQCRYLESFSSGDWLYVSVDTLNFSLNLQRCPYYVHRSLLSSPYECSKN